MKKYNEIISEPKKPGIIEKSRNLLNPAGVVI